MQLAAGRVSQSDRIAKNPVVIPTVVQPAPPLMSETFAKDAIITWFRGEFAAANAIIDALCNHLTQLDGCTNGGGGRSEYESVFAAIHRRRLNWIPILQMQKFCSIADVVVELQKVTTKKAQGMQVNKEAIKFEQADEEVSEHPISKEDKFAECDPNQEAVDEISVKEDLPESEIADTGSEAMHISLENVKTCFDHDGYDAHRDEMKITKGFTAKEPFKGHMVNVVRGLKLYEDVFTESQLTYLSNFVDELRVAGRDGELSGETYMLYNQTVKGKKREMIQLGVPIFGHIQEEANNTKCQRNNIEPIPALLEGIIEHLIQWHIISESRRPNGCIINFFDEGEYSQPFLKPPHVDQPISTLLLSKSTMAFGRTLVNDNGGNYRGPLVLSLNEGSLLVMRGNSSDVARHVMCSTPNKRVSITFVRIRLNNEINSPKTTSLNKSITLWHQGIPAPNPNSDGTLNGYGQVNMIPKWAPILMLAPLSPIVVSPTVVSPTIVSPPRKVPCNGTGVFLPWTVEPKKPMKQLPPRAQKGRVLTVLSASDACNKGENVTDMTVKIDQKIM